LDERFEHGNITIAELVVLSGRCRATIYKDISAGILKVVRFGKSNNASVFVPGAVAKAYIAGELHQAETPDAG